MTRTRLPPHPAAVWRFGLTRLKAGAFSVVTVMRAVLADRELSKRYFRVVLLQLGITLVVAALYSDAWDRIPETDIQDGGFHVVIHKTTAFWASFLFTLSVVEWIVIALSRDFHDELTWYASRAAGLPPEDAQPPTPRIRINAGWAFKKLKRRIQGWFLVGFGVPPLALLRLIPEHGDLAFSVALALWGVWWLMVFTVGKTAFAWSVPAARDPWFLHAFESTPVGRWWLTRVYLDAWKRVTGAARIPAFLVEKVPMESLGLTLVRTLFGLPGIYLLIRPIVPVAAAIIVERAGFPLEASTRVEQHGDAVDTAAFARDAHV